MFEILSNIFGSNNALKKGMSMIDEAFYTDSEKAVDKQKAIDNASKHRIELMKSYEPFKLAQRYIALSFVFVYLFVMLNGIMAELYGFVEVENVVQARKFAENMYLGPIVLMIVSFYFGGGLVNSIKTKGSTPGK